VLATATGQIRCPLPALTPTTPPLLFSPIFPSVIPLIDSGSGCCVTSHSLTGKSKSFLSPPHVLLSLLLPLTLSTRSGAPKNTPTIVSRLVTAAYWQRQCSLYFPPENGYTYDANGHTVHDLNGRTGGWKLTDTTRLIWTNGQFDPWRTSGVSSEFRPGGPLASTPKAPVQIIPGGFHCSDLIARNGLVNEGVQMVIDNEIKQIVEWVGEYPGK